MNSNDYTHAKKFQKTSLQRSHYHCVNNTSFKINSLNSHERLFSGQHKRNKGNECIYKIVMALRVQFKFVTKYSHEGRGLFNF